MDELVSLPDYIRGLARLGDRTALIAQGEARRESASYARLIERAEAFAAALSQNGIGAGERVLLWGAPGLGWAAAFYGCVLAGAVLVPLDAALSAEFAGRVREHTAARLACGDGADPNWPGTAWWNLRQVWELPPAPAPSAPGPPPLPETLLEIVYTSGATAQPKGVMITHGNLLANLRPVAREIARYQSRARLFLPLRFLHLIPLSHLFGQVMGLWIPPLLESAVVFPESQSPAQWAAILHQRRASVVVCVPQQLQLLSQWALRVVNQPAEAVVAASRGHGVPWRWWRWRRLHRALGWKMWALVVGGAALPAGQEELWGALGYAVIQGYGLTETAPAIAVTHPFKARRGAVGRKLAGMELRIAEDGEILVRGGNVSPGYYHDAQATAEVFAGGWLHTGDLGRVNEQGNLHFLGRKKEIIVAANGMNVIPGDVEAALQAQPAVREAAAVPRSSADGSGVHAVVVLRPEAYPSALEEAVAAANRRLEPHQRIQSASLWPTSRLPRTASTGKLRRTAIAEAVHGRELPGPGGAEGEDWRGFVQTRFGIAAERLQPDAELERDLGLSSLDRVELWNWLDSHAGGVEEARIAQARTVADVDGLLQPAVAAVAGAVPTSARVLPMHDVGPWPRRRRWRAARALVRPAVFAALHTAVSPIEVRGIEHLAALRRPVLFIANHQSLLDVPVILRALPPPWRPWLAPAMGTDLLVGGGHGRWWAARAFFNAFPLSDRGNVAASLRYAGQLADEGYCPLIFPEGARTRDGRRLPFRPGIGWFAVRLRIPVVPITLEGLFEILPVGARHARRGPARVTFGPAFEAGARSPEQVTHALDEMCPVRDTIMTSPTQR